MEGVPAWSVLRATDRFSRRVTCVEWHPDPRFHDKAVAFGTHGGDILLWNFEELERNQTIEGVGYGFGAITQMVFQADDPSRIYTTSVNGMVCLQDFEGRHSEVFLNTMDMAFWWTALAVSDVHNVIFVGGNTGKAVLLDRAEGRIIVQHPRLHKDKIQHAEFCPASDCLLLTCSNDHLVCLWDIRMLREVAVEGWKPVPLASMKHGAPVSSAYFDPIFGSRILTTAQNSELRVYEAHRWDEPSAALSHPHRSFQHMTRIRATWHPVFEDLCVVGRYPEKGSPDQTRGVDVVDLRRREVVGMFYNPSLKGLIQVNKFSPQGKFLASGMGYQGLLWEAGDVLRARGRVARGQPGDSTGHRALPHTTTTGTIKRSSSRKRKEKLIESSRTRSTVAKKKKPCN